MDWHTAEGVDGHNVLYPRLNVGLGTSRRLRTWFLRDAERTELRLKPTASTSLLREALKRALARPLEKNCKIRGHRKYGTVR